jgi:Ribosomal proteins 50S-L18Ae/60S-L20/60S-L18A
MYKEYRDLSRTDAVKSMYQDMAARHRARFRSIHVRSLFPLEVLVGSNDGFTDPPSRRDQEGRRHSPPLHQATHHSQPQVPSPSQDSQGPLDLRRQASIHHLSGILVSKLGQGATDRSTYSFIVSRLVNAMLFPLQHPCDPIRVSKRDTTPLSCCNL